MCNSSWVLLLVTALAGALGFGGFVVTYAWAWRSLFALFLVLSLARFLCEYRTHCSH